MEKQRPQSPVTERREQAEPSTNLPRGSSTSARAKQTKPKRKRRTWSAGEKILFFSFKWIFILFCLFISVIAGRVIGYSIIGDGKAGEVFDLRMWKHIYDLVFNV